MYYTYDIEQQLRRILKNKTIFVENIESTTDYYKDVYDGEIYKQMLNSPHGYLIRNKSAYTFTINTDVISLCEKSKLDVWPIYLVINEIKPEYRFCIENVIVAGIIFIIIYS